MYENYCKFRDLRGLKDADVAKVSGVSKSTFSDWKSGRSCPKNEKLVKIASALGVSVDYLVTGEQEEFSKESALLDAKISKDAELKAAIEKYYTLNDKNKKHVLELIDLLSGEA